MYDNKVGVIFNVSRLLSEGPDVLFDLGLDSIQLTIWSNKYATPEVAAKVKQMLQGKIEITSVWGGWSGPRVWNFIDGPVTLGIVPEAYRDSRLKELMLYADFATELEVPYFTTHMGFMPEQPCYPGYRGIVQAVRYIANYCKDRGMGLNFETGQETPVTLMRVIQDTGCDNLGVNLDPANLILYGRGNPVDAIDIFGDRIKGVHVKDGNYPKDDFYKLGEETVVGEGSVNYPVFLPKLLKQGYKGDLYIEREISGEQQTVDIRKTIDYVRKTLAGEN